jgi:hypothetical protein
MKMRWQMIIKVYENLYRFYSMNYRHYIFLNITNIKIVAYLDNFYVFNIKKRHTNNEVREEDYIRTPILNHTLGMARLEGEHWIPAHISGNWNTNTWSFPNGSSR